MGWESQRAGSFLGSQCLGGRAVWFRNAPSPAHQHKLLQSLVHFIKK